MSRIQKKPESIHCFLQPLRARVKPPPSFTAGQCKRACLPSSLPLQPTLSDAAREGKDFKIHHQLTFLFKSLLWSAIAIRIKSKILSFTLPTSHSLFPAINGFIWVSEQSNFSAGHIPYSAPHLPSPSFLLANSNSSFRALCSMALHWKMFPDAPQPRQSPLTALYQFSYFCLAFVTIPTTQGFRSFI